MKDSMPALSRAIGDEHTLGGSMPYSVLAYATRRTDRSGISTNPSLSLIDFQEPSALVQTALRYPYEVRKEEEYFADIREPKIPKDVLQRISLRQRRASSIQRNSRTNTKMP